MGSLPSSIQEVIAPHPEDTADLRWALDTVATMWARGAGRKTLLWLKQAAQTARGDCLDARADALSRAAAEFERLGLGETTVSGEVALPPARPDAPAAAEPPPASAPEPAASPRRNIPPTAPYSLAQTRKQAPSATVVDAAPLGRDMLPDRPAEPASTPRPSRPEPPKPHHETLEATVVVSQDPALLGSLMLDAAKPPAAASSGSGDNTLVSLRAPLEPMRAVRVAVRPGGGNELSAVLLDDGEAAPEGTQEAILLAIGSDQHK